MFSRLIRVAKGRDRRRERRVQIRQPAEIDDVPGRITDISLGGCGFYANERGLEVGTDVTARLKPQGETPFEIPARIVGSDEEGMVLCVAFREVSPEAFDRLQNMIVHQSLGGHGGTADPS